MASASAAPQQSCSPTQEITQLLQQDRVADALEFALSQGDMDCLMHFCHDADIGVLDEKPCSVPQKVIGSLIQQLGFDLESELEIKMEWLQVGS